MASPGQDDGIPLGASPPRRRWRLAPRTLIVVVVATAVGFAVVERCRRIIDRRRPLEAPRVRARELVVADPSRPAAARAEPLRADGDRWVVYLPPGGPYRLGMATRAIDETDLGEPGASASIGPGDHEVALVVEPSGPDWLVRATVDGKPKLAIEEPAAWKGNGSTSGSDVGGATRSFAPGRPIVLTRRRHEVAGSTTTRRGPAPGVLLWIETGPTTGQEP